MRRGFTLIELMVASILLAMIVTILTMVFNQSSIAWRTGVASVVNLNKSRAALGVFHDIRDAALPGLGGSGDRIQYRTVSLWDENEENQLRFKRKRAFNFDENEKIKWDPADEFTLSQAQKAEAMDVAKAEDSANKKIGFSVGVRSWGPDGQPDTPDDISTWPEDIE